MRQARTDPQVRLWEFEAIGLSSRQLKVMRLHLAGQSPADIAAEMQAGVPWVEHCITAAERLAERRKWVEDGEGGILSQRFIATVTALLPDYVQRRWVIARWHDTPVDTIAEHYCATECEVRASLGQARGVLDENRDHLLGALVCEEKDLADCRREMLPKKHQPPEVIYANWKSGLAKGEYAGTPAMPKIRQDSVWNMADERLEYLLRLLAE